MYKRIHSLKNIKFLTKNKKNLNCGISNTESIFNNKVISFFNDLSNKIFKTNNLNLYPDLASFGFFCRKNNLIKLKKRYLEFLPHRYGRGITLHYAPSNVPLNFAYSLLVGLVSGNSCIVKLPSKNFNQSKLLVNLINQTIALKKHEGIKKKLFLVKFAHSQEINDELSKICDVRIIWGGNNTINEIRKSSIKERSFDVSFADRYSVSIINSKNYLFEKKYEIEAENFFNDTLAFDQNACSSPRLIFWLGSKSLVKRARNIFWERFENKILEKKYKHFGNTIVRKILSEQIAAIELGGDNTNINDTFKFVKKSIINKVPNDLNPFISPGGFFLEYEGKKINDFKKNINSKMQTLTYIGFDKTEIIKKLDLGRLRSIDRVVKNGRSSEFSFEWDGYDLIFFLSRKISTL